VSSELFLAIPNALTVGLLTPVNFFNIGLQAYQSARRKTVSRCPKTPSGFRRPTVRQRLLSLL